MNCLHGSFAVVKISQLSQALKISRIGRKVAEEPCFWKASRLCFYKNKKAFGLLRTHGERRE